MARILICHVPKDGNAARDMGSALMARGHFVSFDGEPDAPRADRSTRLRQFEGVVVVWTETSYQSAGLAQIAREVLPLNLLIPVRSEKLDIGRLPLVFRKLNMLSPRDFDGLARLIARLSTAASSMKEIAQQVAKLDEEPRRPLPPIVPRQPAARKLEPPPVSEPEPLYHRQQPAPIAAKSPPFAEAIIPASHAQRTAHRPVHFGLPDVTDPDDMDADDTYRGNMAPEPQPLAPLPPPARTPAPPPFVSKVAMPPKAINAPQRPQVPTPAATRPPNPPADPSGPYSAIANAQELSQAIEAGLLLHYIPETMWLGEGGQVEVRLDRRVLDQVFGQTDLNGARGAMIESLSLSLYGTGDAFEIERLSERTQPVGRDPFIVGEVGERWIWLVTPQAAGTQDLVVRVSALMLDRHGVPAPVALPDRRFRVDIEAREGGRVMSSLSGWLRR